MDASTRFNNRLRYRPGDAAEQVHLTPAYVLEPVRCDLGGIGLDPCTTPENPTGADVYYTVAEDGLLMPWQTTNFFVNPPYGKAREPWVGRVLDAAESGLAGCLLMPAATDTRCFQRAARAAEAVVLVRGRLKFGVPRPNGRQVAASHPSALFFYNARPVKTAALGLVVAS